MKITLSGHHVDITDGLREAVEAKFKKIASHYPQIDSVFVTLTVEPSVQHVEASTHFMGATVIVKAQDRDLYVAIGESVKKLDAALKHKKGAVKSNGNHKPDAFVTEHLG